MDDFYKNIEEYNPNKQRKILIILDYMIADTINNKKLNPIVNELFITGRKLCISLVFKTKSYFAIPKKYYTKFYTLFYYENFKQSRLFHLLQQIIFNHSSDINLKGFTNLYKNVLQNRILF